MAADDRPVMCSLASGGVSAGSEVAQSEFASSAAERLQILRDYRRIAMVGLSGNERRPSYFAAVYLQAAGYEVIPVNPRADVILGQKAYGSLSEIPGPVDVVDVFRPSAAVPPIVDEAIAIGAKAVWMQFGVVHYEAAQKAREAGLQVVMDQCMKVEHARYFGGLNTVGLNTGVLSSRRWSRDDGRK